MSGPARAAACRREPGSAAGDASAIICLLLFSPPMSKAHVHENQKKVFVLAGWRMPIQNHLCLGECLQRKAGQVAHKTGKSSL